LLVNNGTNFTTALYRHRFGSRNVIGHLTMRSAVAGFLYRWSFISYLASLLRYYASSVR